MQPEWLNYDQQSDNTNISNSCEVLLFGIRSETKILTYGSQAPQSQQLRRTRTRVRRGPKLPRLFQEIFNLVNRFEQIKVFSLMMRCEMFLSIGIYD